MSQRDKFNMLLLVKVIISHFYIFVGIFAEDVILLSGNNWMVSNDEKGGFDLLANLLFNSHSRLLTIQRVLYIRIHNIEIS